MSRTSHSSHKIVTGVQTLSTTDLSPEERRRRGAQAAAKTRERNQREERTRRTQAIMDARNKRVRRNEDEEEDDDVGETDLAAPAELGDDSDARPLFEAKKKKRRSQEKMQPVCSILTSILHLASIFVCCRHCQPSCCVIVWETHHMFKAWGSCHVLSMHSVSHAVFGAVMRFISVYSAGDGSRQACQGPEATPVDWCAVHVEECCRGCGE